MLFVGYGFSALTTLAQESAAPPRGFGIVPANNSTGNVWRDHKDYALLFATDEYEHWQKLANPVDDAETIGKMLSDDYGFQVEVVKNPSRDDILTKLREYEKKHFDDGDQLLIFFAGHGSYDNDDKQGYIVARDTKAESEDPNRLTYESYDDLQAKIDAIPTKHLLLVLDACFGGAFDRRIGEATSRGATVYSDIPFQILYAEKTASTTRKYLTSGGKTYVSDGEPGQHSPFVRNLLQTLATQGGKKEYLSFEDIEAGVESTQPEPYGGDWGRNVFGSDFYFVSNVLKLSGSVASRPTLPVMQQDARRHSIAVLDLEDLSSTAKDTSIAASLSEGLTTDLPRGGLRPVDGEDVADAVRDLDLHTFSAYSRDTLAKIDKILQVDWVVTGSYSVRGAQPDRQIHLDLRVQDAHSGDIIATDGEDGTEAGLSTLILRASNNLETQLGVEPSADTQVNRSDTQLSSNTDALENYGKGMKQLQTYDLAGALDSLKAAVAADPQFALAHAALSDTLFQLGYDKDAEAEGQAAYRLSANLPLEKHLIIEASYREKTAEWDRAIEVYKELHRDYPDERDYALELSAVQSAAGEGQDALATLADLRRSDPTAVADPRIDYEEAIAAESLTDFKREQAAAVAAADKASKQGARLLVAKAYWQDCDALFGLGNLKDAEDACRKANAAADDTGQLQVKARSLTALARILAAEGQTSEAMLQQQNVLRMVKEIGSQKDIIGALVNLAMSESAEGRLAEAEAHEREAIADAKKIEDKEQLFDAENNLAADSTTSGDYEQAKISYEDALTIARESGDQAGIAIAMENLGSLALQTGNLAIAERDVRQGLANAEGGNFKSTAASAYGNLGDVELVKANFAEAQKDYEKELQLFTDIGDKANMAGAQLSLAKLTLEQGNAAEAQKLAQGALQEFDAEKLVDNQCDALNTVAKALMAQGTLSEAQAQIDVAAKLGAQDYAIRLSLRITGARLKARQQKVEEAERDLKSLLAETQQTRLLGAQFEDRLALAEIETRPDLKSSLLTALKTDARAADYELIVRKASDPDVSSLQ